MRYWLNVYRGESVYMALRFLHSVGQKRTVGMGADTAGT